MKNRGTSFIEALVSLTLILLMVTPSYIYLEKIVKNKVYLKKKISIEERLEKIIKIIEREQDINTVLTLYDSTEVEVRKELIEDNFHRINIKIINDNSTEREVFVYVYKQK
nr:hypothetical protein [uncultured Cetobacterium sp.]